MRPLRLELQGFASFRDETVFDFEGIDFFALVGPTGNGKSTVIDAIGFALYGKVPRHDDRSAASSIVSLGAIEARVRLTFEVNGTRYVAVRTVKIRNDKAKQDVRLETEAGDLIAAQVREFGEQIETILGMPFEDFTRCVALPQGEFQKFLHEEPKQRRSVLVRLLNLGSYEELGRKARDRAAKLNDHIGFLETQRAQLLEALPDPAAVSRRRTALIDFAAEVEAALPVEQQFMSEVEEIARRIQFTQQYCEALAIIAVPDGIQSLGVAMSAAQDAFVAGQTASAQAATALANLEIAFAQRQKIASLATLENALKTTGQLAKLNATMQARAAALADLDQRVAVARVTNDAAAEARHAADATLERERSLHRAHALREHLRDGDECPVCVQIIPRVPTVTSPTDFAVAQQAAKAAVESERVAHQAAAALDKERSAASSALDTLREQAARLQIELNEVQGIEDLETALDELRTTDQALKTHRTAAAEAVANERQVFEHLQKLQRSGAEFQKAFDKQRDQVSVLQPPERVIDDLPKSWQLLSQWAVTASDAMRAELDIDAATINKLNEARSGHVDEIQRRARELEVEAPDLARVATSTAAAIARCDAAIESSATQLASAQKMVEEIAAEREEQGVAELLGKLLRTDAFVDWLVEEALETLVTAASITLFELSAGQYSLRHGASTDFEIIDHANADATRSVRSLSGGETFQASLALALALSDQLADLAANGAAKLEAIFLDEGFGTLDPESLDTVATTIERLGSSGRMVGIVTHVRDLAQRVPVRFEITKIGNRSQVQMVTS